jgi:anti-anti-sigma regulatory factor
VPYPTASIQVHQTGKRTVVGFRDAIPPADVDASGLRQRLQVLLEEHECETLVFDLPGVTVVPSGFIGLLVSLDRQGIQVRMRAVTSELQQILAIARLEDFVLDADEDEPAASDL